MPDARRLGFARELRDAGIATEVYFADGNRSMRDQLAFANARQVAIAVIVGEDELKEGTVTIKDLRRRVEGHGIADPADYVRLSKSGQIRVSQVEMLATVQNLLAVEAAPVT